MATLLRETKTSRMNAGMSACDPQWTSTWLNPLAKRINIPTLQVRFFRSPQPSNNQHGTYRDFNCWTCRTLISSPDRRSTMKTLVAFAFLAILAFATTPAEAVERACRPSLSNAFHCPDKSASQPQRKTTNNKSTNTDRPCRPSLSNGYNCPGVSSEGRGSTPPKKTASTPDRECRPSLSNGFNCSGRGQAGVNQYTTETLAWAHCPTDTVVWLNTKSGIYHFRSTANYGSTKAGAYMCEQDARATGMRAAKNEKHPS